MEAIEYRKFIMYYCKVRNSFCGNCKLNENGKRICTEKQQVDCCKFFILEAEMGMEDGRYDVTR